jgi:hypothetical protein
MLELMYADPARWTFTFQTQVLAHYADVYRRYADAGPVFVERSPVSALVFISMAIHRNALTVDELNIYLELHAAVGWEPDTTVSPRRAARQRGAAVAHCRSLYFPQRFLSQRQCPSATDGCASERGAASSPWTAPTSPGSPCCTRSLRPPRTSGSIRATLFRWRRPS